MHLKRGTRPLLKKRVQEAQTAPKKSRSLPLGFEGRVSKVAVMIMAAASYGVEVANISKKTAASLESTVACTMGPQHAMSFEGNNLCPSRAGTPRGADHGHRVPENVLAGTGSTHKGHATNNHTSGMGSCADAEGDRAMGRALQEFRKLGWQPLVGWWKWTYPGAHAPLNLALDFESYVEHVFREALRKQQLRQLEARRPRLRPRRPGGMDATIHRVLTLTHTTDCGNELVKALLRGVLARVLRIAARAQARGLRHVSILLNKRARR